MGRRGDVAPRDARPAQPERLGHRLRTGPVVATAQPGEDPAHDALVSRAGLLEPGVRLQRHLGVYLLIPHAGHAQGELLVRQIDEAPLPPPPSSIAAIPSVPGAGQRMHFLLDQRARRLEPERDERLQEHGPQIPGPQRRSDVWAHCFHLAFLGDPQYVGHGAASLPVVG